MLSRFETGYNFSPGTYYLAPLAVAILLCSRIKPKYRRNIRGSVWRHSWWLFFHKIPHILLRRGEEKSKASTSRRSNLALETSVNNSKHKKNTAMNKKTQSIQCIRAHANTQRTCECQLYERLFTPTNTFSGPLRLPCFADGPRTHLSLK